MSTAQAFTVKEYGLNGKHLNSNGKMYKLEETTKLLKNGKSETINNNKPINGKVSKSKLEEQFKAGCDAIQNLPKNGIYIEK